jgi:PAS domain S-box-containing protein
MSTRVLVVLWTLAVALAAGAIALLLASDYEESKFVAIGLNVPIGLMFVGAGLVGWSRRPENRTGPLMVAVGFTWFLGTLVQANEPALVAAGLLLGNLLYGPFVHLALAYPSGRLEGKLDRALVALSYGLITVGQLVLVLFNETSEAGCVGVCPENPIQIEGHGTIAAVVRLAWRFVAVVIAVTVVVLLARRWREATRPLRRVLAPVYLTVSGVAALLVVALATDAVTDAAEDELEVILLLLVLTVPLSFLFGLLRSRLARAGATRLLLQTPDNPTPAEAQDGLRRTLGDPALRLAIWLPDEQHYVDVEGRPFELPADTEATVTTLIEYEDRPIAALVHDAMLLDEPGLLDEVVATARVALERDLSLEALRASEERTRALLDAIPDLMFRIRRDGTYLDFKAESEGDLLSPEVIGRSVYDRLPRDLAEEVMNCARRSLDEGIIETVEYELQFDGQPRYYEGRIVRSGEDEFLLIVREITERRRLQDDLRTSMEELRMERDLHRTVVDTAPTFFCGVDSDGRIIRFNRALERLSGHSPQGPMTGRPFWDVFIAPEQAREVEKRFRRATTSSSGAEYENAWVTRDGDKAIVAWSANWYPGERGETRYLITGTDVTKRNRAETALELLAEEQAALRRVATLVASEAPPERIFQLATEEAARVVGAQSSGMVRFEEDGTGRVVGRWHGGGPSGFEIGSVVPLEGPTSLPQVFRSGQPARVESYAESSGSIGEQMRTLGFSSSVAAPIKVGGNLWGAVIVASSGPEPLPANTEQRLDNFADLVALALASADAKEEIVSSRARIVQAGDAARRNLERNLHDGAQQRLVVLSLSLRLAHAKLKEAPDEAERLLEETSEQLAQALDDLRELARGIHPAVLSDRGLEPALRALASRSPIPVEIDTPADRLPEAVEAAAYYVASEALANATKYAQASEVSVRVACNNGLAVVEIADDGVGGADPSAGSGLRGLSDRVAALHGRLEVASEPGAGTRIVAKIPLEPSEAAT